MPFDTAGNEVDEVPGPAGNRMAQLGILTRSQKKKPVANPADTTGLSATLLEKAQERKAELLKNGPAGTVSEADPMKTSMVKRTVPGRPK